MRFLQVALEWAGFVPETYWQGLRMFSLGLLLGLFACLVAFVLYSLVKDIFAGKQDES